ncbi:hypothetical protein E4U17_002078 [Claviceps sp. LM77 group G4]|nr:hypothetical protein E4U17_002078 [Claviceps sp. LM77 group G4]KAG6076876.1 hypothetical protein E4U16_002535 [Claviceps sp. LM84 group G4]
MDFSLQHVSLPRVAQLAPVRQQQRSTPDIIDADTDTHSCHTRDATQDANNLQVTTAYNVHIQLYDLYDQCRPALIILDDADEHPDSLPSAPRHAPLCSIGIESSRFQADPWLPHLPSPAKPNSPPCPLQFPATAGRRIGFFR